MRKGVLLAGLALVSALAIAQTSKVDVDKVPGIWFVVNTDPTLYSSNVHCFGSVPGSGPGSNHSFEEYIAVSTRVYGAHRVIVHPMTIEPSGALVKRAHVGPFYIVHTNKSAECERQYQLEAGRRKAKGLITADHYVLKPTQQPRKLVSKPLNFDQMLKDDPIGACAHEMAVLKQQEVGIHEAAKATKFDKGAHCNLSEEDLAKAEARAIARLKPS